MPKYKAPFPWFGGKSRVAHIVWALLGDVNHYLEPFFGSGAVLFLRPEDHKNYLETVNDKDMLIANFWRAVQKAPDEVAYYADYPVNEADLTARHIWLVKYGIPELESRLQADPEYFDAKIAGWWVWGISQWIGSGWCSGNGCWTEEDGRLVKIKSNNSVYKKVPQIGKSDKGVLSVGISKKSPYISKTNMGITKFAVHRVRPHISNHGTGVSNVEDIYEYMNKLSERLRRVRVICGDWSRLVTKGALSCSGIKGIFLDPPYSKSGRDDDLYRNDEDVSKAVNQWCLKNGDNPEYRIVLCGYEGEHNNLEELGWKKIAWTGVRAYGNSKNKTQNAENRYKERIWYNQSCLTLENQSVERSNEDEDSEED